MRDRFLILVTTWGAYVVAGLLLGVGFVWSAFWPLGIVGVPVFLYAVTKSRTLFQALFGSVMTFTIKMGLAILWFWSTYPIIWIDLALGRAELPVIGFYWLTVSLAIGLAGLVPGFFLYQLRSLLPSWQGALVVVPLWVLTEVLGSIMFSIWTLGPGGSVNAVFSFGYSGYLLANHSWLLPFASVGGVYLLSAIAAMSGVCMYLYWSASSNKTKASEFICIAVLLLAISAAFTVKLDVTNPTAPNFSVAIVDTTFGGADYFDRADREVYKISQLREALTAALESGARYVVMSEDSRYLDARLEPEIAYGYFRFQNGDPSTVVIEAGAVPIGGNEIALRASLYDGTAKKAYGVDKQYLVPQGEFMPTVYSWLLTGIGAGKAAQAISDTLRYRPGPLATQQTLPTHLPGILFCFASANPLSIKQLTAERTVPFIAHPISHAWFHEPDSLWQQFDAMLKVHAVWSNAPIVSAGNMVEGALYTAHGTKRIGEVYAAGERWQVRLVGW